MAGTSAKGKTGPRGLSPEEARVLEELGLPVVTSQSNKCFLAVSTAIEDAQKAGKKALFITPKGKRDAPPPITSKVQSGAFKHAVIEHGLPSIKKATEGVEDLVAIPYLGGLLIAFD